MIYAPLVPQRPGPPRPLAIGDIVTCYNRLLGEWSAAQINEIKDEWKQIGLIDLDWSGPEPTSVDDLGGVVALLPPNEPGARYLDKCRQRYADWVLPRSCLVLGNLPLVPTGHLLRSGGHRWDIGDSLWAFRRWEAGERDEPRDPTRLSLPGSEFRDLLDRVPDSTILSLGVFDGGVVNVEQIAELFPNLEHLGILGSLDTLLNSRAIARLSGLRSLDLYDVFGMTADDVVTPAELPHLEHIWLQSIPQEYSAAMSKIWRPEAVNGTFLQIFEARRPNWIAENRDNPLRDWDGREELRPIIVKKAFAQYKSTRQSVLASLRTSSGMPEARVRLAEIGVEFAEAFNTLDAKWMFIETQERDELLDALAHLAGEASSEYDVPREDVEQALLHAANETRDW